MNEHQEVPRKMPAKSGIKGPKRARGAIEMKLRAVKLHRDEGHGQAMVRGKMGIAASTLAKFVRECRARATAWRRGVAAPVTEEIAELKRQNPSQQQQMLGAKSALKVWPIRRRTAQPT